MYSILLFLSKTLTKLPIVIIGINSVPDHTRSANLKLQIPYITSQSYFGIAFTLLKCEESEIDVCII